MVGEPRPALTLPEHISYSAKDTLDTCAKAYFLSRIAKAPKRPALWLAGGSAVHEVTEAWDLKGGRMTDAQLKILWEATYERWLGDLRSKDADETRWRMTKQGIEQWRSDGLDYVQAWIDWRKRSPWRIVKLGGELAIELDVSGRLPGCEVEIKGYIDRLMYDPAVKAYYIVDLKTGTRKPKSPAQFGTYSALLKAKYNITATWGVPFMNRKATTETPFDLTKYTPEYVGLMYGRAWAQVKAGLFNPNLGDCFLCDVQEACYANGGFQSERFDPDDPRYAAPF